MRQIDEAIDLHLHLARELSESNRLGSGAPTEPWHMHVHTICLVTEDCHAIDPPTPQRHWESSLVDSVDLDFAKVELHADPLGGRCKFIDDLLRLFLVADGVGIIHEGLLLLLRHNLARMLQDSVKSQAEENA